MEIVPDSENELEDNIVNYNKLPPAELLKRQEEAVTWLRQYWKLGEWKHLRGDNIAQDLERFKFATDALQNLADEHYAVPLSESGPRRSPPVLRNMYPF